MHAIAWVAWVSMVMVIALSTTNPLYLAIVLLSVLLVSVLAPRTATAIAGFRALLVLGVGLMVLSIGIATINAAGGDHVIFTLPGPQFPEWMGGLRLGGPVTWEALTGATIRGLAILCVFLAFAVFNGAVSPHRVLRMTPAALFHAGLIVTIGLTLLPSTIEDLRRIREAQALRGHPGGLRGLPSLVVPAVIGGLERSFRLAEAMEARGYAAAPSLTPVARIMGVSAAPLILVSALTWFYGGEYRWLGALPGAAALAALGGWGWLSTRRRVTSSLQAQRVGLVDAVASTASFTLAIAVFVAASGGWIDLSYNPFSELTAPAFHPAGAGLVLATAWPAVRLLLAPRAAAAEQATLVPGPLNA